MKVRKFLWELKLKSRLLVNEFRVRWNHPSWECQNDLRNFWWIIFSSHTSASVFVFHILICIFRKFFIILLWLPNLLWSIIMFRFILTFLFIRSIKICSAFKKTFSHGIGYVTDYKLFFPLVFFSSKLQTQQQIVWTRW